MNKTVSIVVPVYNLSNSLEKCLNSIINQTYKELEIILIDDGSKDSSLSICKKFAAFDKRIKVFSHVNHGVSYTRNIGLKNATGYYLMFIDGDDIVSRDMVERYVYCAVEEDCDIVIGGLYFVENETITSKIPEAKILNRKQLLSNICVDMTGIYGYVSNKLYKLENIKNNQILFDEQMYAQEDLDFALSVYKVVDKIVQISYSGYTYFHQCGKRNIPMLDLIKNQNKLLAMCFKNQVDAESIAVLKNKICIMLFSAVYESKSLNEIESFNDALLYPLEYSGKSIKVWLVSKLYNKNEYKIILFIFRSNNFIKGFLK